MPRQTAQPELLSPFQKARLSEATIANAIHVLTRGRLHCARPVVDDHGVDYHVYDHRSPISLSLQIKVAFAVVRGKKMQFVVNLSEIPRDPASYFVLCCQAAPGFPGIAPRIWLIPGGVFSKRGRRGYYHFFTSVRSERGSQWDPYRINLPDLGGALDQALKDVGRRTPRPYPGGRPREIGGQIMGRVLEDAVVRVLYIHSDGALCAFRPEVDSIGLDFLVRTAAHSHALGLQVKGAFTSHPRGRVHVKIKKDAVRPESDSFLFVLSYLPETLSLGPCVWIIRMDELVKVARLSGGTYRFQASPNPASHDKYTPWRYRPEEAAGVILTALEVLNREGPAARLPARRSEVQAAAKRLRLSLPWK